MEIEVAIQELDMIDIIQMKEEIEVSAEEGKVIIEKDLGTEVTVRDDILKQETKAFLTVAILEDMKTEDGSRPFPLEEEIRHQLQVFLMLS